MGLTSIEWTSTILPDGTTVPGYTFNPWIGCTKLSPACDHCYAEDWVKRYRFLPSWDGERRRTSKDTWREPRTWNRKAEKEGRRHRVFCASLADVFDNQVPSEWRDDLFGLIADTPHLDWMLLTKRPQNIRKMLPPGFPWPNVWLGTTTENKEEAALRIPHLQAAPAVIRFLSCEPLLEEVLPNLSGIHWVICGGESHPGKRLMRPEWARALMSHCHKSGVAFFMKQMTKRGPIPDDLMVRQWPC